MLPFIKRVYKKITDDKITVYAAQASFYVVIAGIPFLYLLFIPFAAMVESGHTEIAGYISMLIPETISGMIWVIAGEIIEKSNLRLLGFSAVTLMWTASRGTQAVERGVRRVYGAENRRGFFKSIVHSVFYTLAFIVIIVASLLVLSLGGILIEKLSVILTGGIIMQESSEPLRFAAAFAVLTVIFSYIYRSFSCGGDSLYNHLSGGAFSCVGWIIFSKLYSVYTVYFSNHSYIYGSFAAVVLFMLWIYSCMIIFLLGAEVNVILKEWRRK